MRKLLVLGLLAACKGDPLPTPDPVCPVLLECAAPVEVACTAPATPVEVADAARCDAADNTDDRVDTYPLGDTTLSFSARLVHPGVDRTAACTTRVTVVDEVPPEVSCETSLTFARATPDEPMPDVPVGTATDTCDDDVTIDVSPPVLTEPLTDVITTATDGSGNVATCTTAVEVLDLYAVPGFRMLGAELDDDGTVVTLGWELPDSPDVDRLRVQRAPSASGPWETVATVPARDQLGALTQTERTWYRLVSVGQDLEGGATEPIDVHAVATDAYDLRDVSVATIPYPTTLYGVVRHPADLDGGPYPLVLLMHGNHGNCRRNGTTDDYCATTADHECNYSGYSTTPNAEGMAFQAEMLAARGMIAATVSANAMNCRAGYILERAQLLRAHLQVWADWQSGTPGPSGTKFASKLDLSRVGLVGHSRGGDAVSHVPQALADAPISGVDVVSVFATAPTDYNDATVFETSYALLLPACDGDVSNLWGTDIYERSTDVWHKSQVFFPGANHNFFNTEWFYDDGQNACARRDRVGAWPQVAMLHATLGPWMSRTLDEDAPTAVQRGEAPSPSSLDGWAGVDLDLRWSYTEDDALVVDTFVDDPSVNEIDGANTYADFESATQCFGSGCGGAFLHETSAVTLVWRGGSSAFASFGLGSADTSAYDNLSFRVVSTASARNSGRTEQDFRLVVSDADGNVAELDVKDLMPIPHLYGGYDIREVLQTVRVPFDTLREANEALDTTRITTVSLDFSIDGRDGAVTLTDVQLGY